MTGPRIVEVDGLGLRCRVDGADHGAPWLVFSNSLGTTLEVWDAQVAALAGRFRILRYDQRGHGGSAVPGGACDFRRLGDDVLTLLDRFGIQRCTLVGLSMGVPTALRVVEAQPDRVERLVLCDGQATTAAGGSQLWAQRLEQVRTEGMAAFADATVARWFAPGFVASGGADQVRAMLAATPPDGLAACIRALQDYDLSHVLPAIRCPTLLVVGARDGAMPASMARLAGDIAGSRLVEIPDAGHIPNVEQPAAFNVAVMEFVTGGVACDRGGSAIAPGDGMTIASP